MANSPPTVKAPPASFKYELGKTSFDELAKLTKGQLLYLCWDAKILPRGHMGGEWTKSEVATALSTGQVLWKLESEVKEKSSENKLSEGDTADAPAKPRVKIPPKTRPTLKEFVKVEGTLLADYATKFPLLTNAAEDTVTRLDFPVDPLAVVALFVSVLKDCPNALNAASEYAAMKSQPSFAFRRARIVLHREAFQLFNELDRQQVNAIIAAVNDVCREHPLPAEETVAMLAPELERLKIVPRS